MSSWERLAETRIREAIELGELTPPPAGTELDLAGYFALPESERAGLTLLRNAGVVPPEIELLRRLAALEAAVAAASPEAAPGRRAELEQALVEWRLALERRRRAARES